MSTLKERKKHPTNVDMEENHFETRSCVTQVALRLAENASTTDPLSQFPSTRVTSKPRDGC